MSSLGQLLWVCVCVFAWGSAGDEALSAGGIRPGAATTRTTFLVRLIKAPQQSHTHTHCDSPALLHAQRSHRELHTCWPVCVCACVNPPPSSRALASAFRDQRFLRAIILQTPLPPSQPNQIHLKNTHTGVCVTGGGGNVNSQALIYENKHKPAHSHISFSPSVSPSPSVLSLSVSLSHSVSLCHTDLGLAGEGLRLCGVKCEEAWLNFQINSIIIAVRSKNTWLSCLSLYLHMSVWLTCLTTWICLYFTCLSDLWFFLTHLRIHRDKTRLIALIDPCSCLVCLYLSSCFLSFYLCGCNSLTYHSVSYLSVS